MLKIGKEIKSLLKNDKNYLVVRHMSETKCNCWRELSKTPDPHCSRCDGSGWLYREFIQECMNFLVSLARVSHTQDFNYGKSYSNIMTFYCAVSDNSKSITIGDYVYEVANTTTGGIKKPITRLRKWVVTDTFNFEEDDNKTAFIKVLAKPVVD